MDPQINILVPLDDSVLARRALPYATALARHAGGRLTLLSAVAVHGSAEFETLRAAQDHLRDTAQSLGAGIPVEPYVYHEEPVTAILDGARHHEADLIVMSSHGRGGLGRWLHGSVAEGVLRGANVPVVLISAVCEQPWFNRHESSLLVPLDGSTRSERVLPAAVLLAGLLHSRLRLLQVVEPPSAALAGYGDPVLYSAFEPEEELASARRYLEDVAVRLRQQGLIVDVEVAVGRPGAIISQLAAEYYVDAIAMGTHGRGGLSRFVLGQHGLRRAAPGDNALTGGSRFGQRHLSGEPAMVAARYFRHAICWPRCG